MNQARVLQIYPPPHRELMLDGLYLDHDLVNAKRRDAPFVYGNFVCSLDGRVGVENPIAGRRTAPPAITNSRDWRLFQELAAMADALIVGAAFLRRIPDGRESEKLPVGAAPEFADIRDWRRKRGMPEQPAMVVLTRHPDPMLAARCMRLGRPVVRHPD